MTAATEPTVAEVAQQIRRDTIRWQVPLQLRRRRHHVRPIVRWWR